MPRARITRAQINQAAANLAFEGDAVTLASVRKQLGTLAVSQTFILVWPSSGRTIASINRLLPPLPQPFTHPSPTNCSAASVRNDSERNHL